MSRGIFDRPKQKEPLKPAGYQEEKRSPAAVAIKQSAFVTKYTGLVALARCGQHQDRKRQEPRLKATFGTEEPHVLSSKWFRACAFWSALLQGVVSRVLNQDTDAAHGCNVNGPFPATR